MTRISGKNTTAQRSLVTGPAGAEIRYRTLLTLFRQRRLDDIGWPDHEIEPVEPEFDEDGIDDLVDRIAAASGDCVDPEA